MRRVWQPGELISDRVREELPNCIPISVALVVDYIDGEGKHALATFYDYEQTFFAREGMVRWLLRDVLMIPLEAERREAIHQFDHLDDDESDAT